MIDFKGRTEQHPHQGGKPDQAIALLEKAIVDYPEQFTADIALAKILSARAEHATSVQVMEAAYNRGGQKTLPVLKQYTASLANNGNTQALSSIIAEYRELWQEDLNYGHGITMGFLERWQACQRPVKS